MNKSTKGLITFTLPLALATAGFSAYAVTATKDAVIEIIETITISSTGTDLDFGIVSIPESGTESVTIDTSGTRDGSNSDAILVSGGSPTNASYNITAASQEIAITVDSISTATGVTLKDFTGSYNSGTETAISGGSDLSVTPSSSAATGLTIGATVVVDSTTVTTGTKKFHL